MPSVLKNIKCECCGKQHSVYTAADRFLAGIEYVGTCPTTALPFMFNSGAAKAETVSQLPKAAVLVTTGACRGFS